MEYGKCECGGIIIEGKITYYRKFNKQLYAFENVPVGICQECGERIFKGEILGKLEQMSKNKDTAAGEINVPVFTY